MTKNKGSQQKINASDDTKFCYCLQILLFHSKNLNLKDFYLIADELLRLAKK